MKDKIKWVFTHVHHIEDIWVDLPTEDEIRRMDYNELTLEHIIDLNLTKVQEGMMDDAEILDPKYVQQRVADIPIPPTQWSHKECT